MEPTASPVGSWVLASVDGTPLPWTKVGGDVKTVVSSGALSFSASGTGTDVITATQTIGSTSTPAGSSRPISAWSVNGETVTIVYSGVTSPSTATLRGSRLTLTNDTHAYAYERQ